MTDKVNEDAIFGVRCCRQSIRLLVLLSMLRSIRCCTLACGMRTPWVPGQASRPADIEEALNLLVDAADRLDLAVLVHRSGHRQILAQRDIGERQQARA